ncbi:MAG: FAD-binding oxidoreductase [Sinorhizobium meliloti]|jgi:glycine/D-amino acid oxidase-like deaminating enzyme|uniref:NAD(P)/FAD-dependent oxidoreductase n=1 Tax=Rhizobium meliloti TaxID=382 RepID=UPI000FD97154|nr:FAD-binding oxidoreductase [Sinorhizobium meliloti]MCG5486605.1 FAD-binding oxidoreductase [Sinorhizobium meliloti]RVP94770.1 FAD-binding oxidoreductase [Sinorhizobium meliloti]
MSYPNTYYKQTIAETNVRPALSGMVECDSVIIGGGLAGLTTALQLVRAGQSVIVLEAESVGFGASGRNGGFVSPGFATGSDNIARMAGTEAARQIHRLSIEGVEFVRETIETLKIEEARPQPGITSVLRYDEGGSLKAHADEMRRIYGYELDYLSTDEVRSVLKSNRYFHALRDRKAFHMHPLNYLRGLAREIERLGGRIYEGSAATGSVLDSAEKTVSTSGGSVRARHVVFTTGGYTGPLNGRLKRSFLPIATYVMLSEEAPELIRTAIATTDAIGDNRRAGDYYRLVEGGKRLLWGGRITTRAASPAALAGELRREMVGTYPQLKDLKTELAWSGLMSYARHLMPQIGEMQAGVWHCTAFGGHGLNTTAIGGKLVAEGILGQSDRYKLFKPFGLVWAGGYAGLAVAQLTYWKLQAQDWWRERAA